MPCPVVAFPSLYCKETRMVDLDKLTFSETVNYSKEHTWARRDGDLMAVGISDYAQNELGEVVYIELSEVGSTYSTEEVFGFIESIKTASDLYMPLGGEVVEVNESLEDGPEMINGDPFGDGWILKVKAADENEIDTLLDAAGYLKSIS